MTTKEPPFWEQVFESVAPKANRVIATVAFIHTFRQSLNGAAFVGAGGGITLTALGITEINWETTFYAVIAVAAAALASALTAFWQRLGSGLPEGYTRAAVKQLGEQRASQMNTGLQEAVVDAAKAVKVSQEKEPK